MIFVYGPTFFPVFLFGFICFAYVELETYLLVWSNPNLANMRSDVQWYFPLQSKWVFSAQVIPRTIHSQDKIVDVKLDYSVYFVLQQHETFFCLKLFDPLSLLVAASSSSSFLFYFNYWSWRICFEVKGVTHTKCRGREQSNWASENSVNRVCDFFNFLAITFMTKVAQMFGHLWKPLLF